MTLTASNRAARIVVSGARGSNGAKGDPGSPGGGYPTRNAMATAAVGSTNGDDFYLTEAGRVGNFIYRSGDYSAAVTSDPNQGIYVALPTNPSGSSGVLIRDWDFITGYPEWFGAVANSITDSIDALDACHAICRITLLGNGYYTTSRTFEMAISRRQVIGVGANGGSGGLADLTTIRPNFSNSPAIQIGPDSNPGSLGAMPEEIVLKHVHVNASVARTLPSGGLVSNAVSGVTVQFCRRAFIEDVSVLNYALAFKFWGSVYVKVDDCLGQVDSVIGGANDIFWGYYAKGDLLSPSVGLPGGNASLYLDRCSAFGVGGLNGAIGLLVAGDPGNGAGYFVDTYIDKLETGGCMIGAVIRGVGSGISNGNSDFQITNAILDGCAVTGMEIHEIAQSGAVVIDNPYISLSPGATDGILIYQNVVGASTSGSVSITNGQINGSGGGSGSVRRGVRAENFENISIVGLSINDCQEPVKFTKVKAALLQPIISSPTYANASIAAVRLDTCESVIVHPVVNGKAGGWAAGVSLFGTANTRIAIDGTAIIRASTTSGGIIDIAGNNITATGWYNSAGTGVAENAATAVIQVTGVIK